MFLEIFENFDKQILFEKNNSFFLQKKEGIFPKNPGKIAEESIQIKKENFFSFSNFSLFFRGKVLYKKKQKKYKREVFKQTKRTGKKHRKIID